MSWLPIALIVKSLGGGLIGEYAQDGDVWRHEGPRPGPGWHRNDWRPRLLFVWTSTGLVRRVLLRRRWRLAGTNRTHQDRSADEIGGVRAALLVVLIKLWAHLSKSGLPYEMLPALTTSGSARTLRRWLQRCLRQAAVFQQAVIRAAIERNEPRPVEQLFPGGLSPPDALLRHRNWHDPVGISTLWQGLAWLFGGAIKLGVSTTALLAEVRRRTPDLTFTS